MEKLKLTTNYDKENNLMRVSFTGLTGTESVKNVKEALDYLRIENPKNRNNVLRNSIIIRFLLGK